MGRLIYAAIASLDGYVADRDGAFGWAEPSPEVHAFVNDQERSVGTYLYGRRMYETMAGWEGPEPAGRDPISRDFAELWRAADKVVYSTTLERPSTARTTVERVFDPEDVRQRKAAAGRDLSVGGPTLAAAAFRARLVDEVQLYLCPVLVGGGLRALPGGVPLGLRLEDTHRFGDGTLYLRYVVTGEPGPSLPS
jgi:dihydrofolate reductase